jgi:hypothetical protein
MAVLSKKLPSPTNVGPGKVANFNISPGPVMEKFLIQIDRQDGKAVTEAWLKENIKNIKLTVSPKDGSPIDLIKDIPGDIWIELMNNYQTRTVQDGLLVIDFKRIHQLTPQGQDRFLLVTKGLETISLDIELADDAEEVKKMYGEIVHRGYSNALSFFSEGSAVQVFEINRLGQKLAGEFTNTDIPCSQTRGDLLALHIACEDKMKELKVYRDQIQYFNFGSAVLMKQFTETTGTRKAQAGYFHVDLEGMNNRYGESLNLSDADEIRLEGDLSDTVANFNFITVRGVPTLKLKS